jgi:hypothetical protein
MTLGTYSARNKASGMAAKIPREVEMGKEAVCTVRYDGKASEGKALLESNEIIFRGGDFRLKIPFRDIASLDAADGELSVGYNGALAVFELGREAEKWATKIRNPRGLMDKLDVKAGMRVAVLGVRDDAFESQLDARDVTRIDGEERDLDIVFYEADVVDDLVCLSALRSAIKTAGAVWVVSPKGKAARIRDVDVMAAAHDAGFVVPKVASFSDSHTALKLVIPVALRRK